MIKQALIAILNYGNYTQLSYLLDSIQFYTTIDENSRIIKLPHIDCEYSIAVWDACSLSMQEKDALFYRYVRNFVEKTSLRVHYKEITEEQNITSLRNLIAKEYEHDYIVFLHNDILVTPNWLRAILFFLEANDSIGAVTLPTLPMVKELSSYLYCLFHDLQVLVTRRGENFKKYADVIANATPEPRMLNASPLGLRWPIIAFAKEAFTSYDEQLYYFNADSDLIVRLQENGYSSFALGYPFCYHIGGQAFSHSGRKYFKRLVKDNAYFKDKWYERMEYIGYLTSIFTGTLNFIDDNGVIERREFED